MKKCKKLLIAAFAALALALICPSVLPNTGVAKVEAAVKISTKKVVLIKGQTKKLKITGTSKKVTWKSNKKAVATVNKNGKITAKKKGTAKITATIGKKKYTCKVTVQNPSISKKTASIKVGNTVTLKMKGTNQKVTWKSSKTSVATVKSGKVTGKKAGTATITATVLKKKYTCKVTVKAVSSSSSNTSSTTATNTAGTRENPLSAYSVYTTDIYKYSSKVGRFQIQLLDYKDGQEAYDYVMQNEYNSEPTSSQEYIYVKFKITYLSGSGQVDASDVINCYSNFFNSAANYGLDNIGWGYNFEDVDDLTDVSLYPGGSVVCSKAIIVRAGNTPITYRLETGYDSANYETLYTWFTTKK